MSQETREHFEEVIPELATSSSTLERRAIDAERVVEAMEKAEYMEEFVGQEFDGIVGSVVKFGMFVELPKHYRRFGSHHDPSRILQLQ